MAKRGHACDLGQRSGEFLRAGTSLLAMQVWDAGKFEEKTSVLGIRKEFDFFNSGRQLPRSPEIP